MGEKEPAEVSAVFPLKWVSMERGNVRIEVTDPSADCVERMDAAFAAMGVLNETVPCVECRMDTCGSQRVVTVTGHHGRNGIKDGLYHARCWSVRKWMENEKEVS